MRLRHALFSGLLPAVAPVMAQPSINAPGPSRLGEWVVYPGAYNSQRHSPLTQVTLANAARLQVGRFMTGIAPPVMAPMVGRGTAHRPS